MEKASFILGIMLGVSGLHAQNPDPVKTDSSRLAKIVFEQISHDYGGIEKGSEGICAFKFKNEGKAPLILANVSSSCDCTVPSWPKEPIDPGKTGEISVKYNTNVPGRFLQSITITSNASNPKVVLTVKGEVQPQSADLVQHDTVPIARIVFLKLIHDFGTIPKGSDASCTFEFVNRGNIPLLISEVKGQMDNVTASWPKEEIKPGDSGKILVTCNPINLMYFEQYIFVMSNSFDTPAYLRIMGKVE